MMTAVKQAISGMTPPELGEARIREVFPSVARVPLIANLGKFLNNTIILAPLGWLIMSTVYFSKLLPIIGIRYTITNRRVMIRHGWKGTAGQEILLEDIDDVRLEPDSIDQFFRSADLTILRRGGAAMTLKAVPDAES